MIKDRRLSKFCSGIFSSMVTMILAVLGFIPLTACNQFVGEYGAPSAVFKVMGKTVDSETGEPVEGLKAYISRTDNDHGKYENTHVLTDSDGEFILRVRSRPDPDADFLLEISDVDGENNGLYKSTDITLKFRDAEFKDGDNSWYSGEATRNLEKVKVKKETE